MRRGVALLFHGLIVVLSTPWCSETWSYLKPDDPQIIDSCEARVATGDEGPGGYNRIGGADGYRTESPIHLAELIDRLRSVATACFWGSRSVQRA